MAFLVLLGRFCEELVRGRYMKVAFSFRIGGGILGYRASRVSARYRKRERLDRQGFAEEWFGVHQLGDASAMPTDLT